MAPADSLGKASPDGGASASVLHIEVVVGLAPRRVQRVMLQMPAGSTVRQALQAAGVWEMDASITPAAIEAGLWTVGVWGRKERAGHVLRDQDRIELVRPLIVDPKEARRVRYRVAAEKKPGGFQRGKAR